MEQHMTDYSTNASAPTATKGLLNNSPMKSSKVGTLNSAIPSSEGYFRRDINTASSNFSSKRRIGSTGF